MNIPTAPTSISDIQAMLDGSQSTSGINAVNPIGASAQLSGGVIASKKPLILWTGCRVLGQGPATILNSNVSLGCKQGHGYTQDVEFGGCQLNGNIGIDPSATAEMQSIYLHDLYIQGTIDLGAITRYRVTLERVTFVGPFNGPLFKGNARIGRFVDVKVQGQNNTTQPLIQFNGPLNMMNLEACWFETTGGGTIVSCKGDHSQLTEIGNWWELHAVTGPQMIIDGAGSKLIGRVPDSYLGGESINPIVFLNGAVRQD